MDNVNNIENLEELYKMCYEICERAQFNDFLLEPKNKLKKNEIKKYAWRYIADYLKLPNETIEKIILFFIRYNERIFLQTNNAIINEMLKTDFIKKENLLDLDWINEKLKEKVYEFCFEICNKFSWSKKEINEYCILKSIDYNHMYRFANEYKREWATQEQKNNIFGIVQKNTIEGIRENLKNKPGKYATLFNNILNAEKEEQVAYYIEQSGISPYGLKSCIFDYILVHKGASEEVRNILESKINTYLLNLSSKNKVERERQKEIEYKEYIANHIGSARGLINEFIESEYDRINDFCIDKNINKSVFYEYLKIIKENDVGLYEKYSQKQQQLTSKRYAALLSKNKKIVELMKSGIEEDGIVRTFDLMDYFERTSLDFNAFMNSLNGSLEPDEYRTLKIFISKYKNDKPLTPFDIGNLYKQRNVVGVKFDEKDRIIEGTGHELTKEEKQNIIAYLNSKQIPVTRITYNIALNRWISGSIIIEENQDLKQKNK